EALINKGQQQDQNADNSIQALSSDDAYRVFLRHVNSFSLRNAFFNSIYLAERDDQNNDQQRQQLWHDFNKALSIKRPQESTDIPLMVLTLEGKEPEFIARGANQFVEMAMQAAENELLLDLQSAVQLRL